MFKGAVKEMSEDTGGAGGSIIIIISDSFFSSDVWQSDLRDALLVRWFSAQLPPERTHLRQVSFSSFGRDFVILNKEKNP